MDLGVAFGLHVGLGLDVGVGVGVSLGVCAGVVDKEFNFLPPAECVVAI